MVADAVALRGERTHADLSGGKGLAFQSSRYLIVGVVCTALDIGLFNLAAFEMGVPRASAKIASTAVAIVLSFALNRAWTFAGVTDKVALRRQFAWYVAINTVSALFSVACMQVAATVG